MSIQQLVREQCYSFFFLILLTGCFSFQGRSQEENNEAVKKRQRAIFVYNFAQQVQWKNIEDNQFFKIGVLGMDATIYDLQSLAQKRKIQGKPVEVSRFLKADNLRGIQLLYVNNKFKYDINYILKKISGKGILLVTEDYNFNSSMINMVNVGNSFEYEINERHIEKEGFVYAVTLKRYAIRSPQKWKKLYKTLEKDFDEALEKNKEQERLIEDREKEITRQEKTIGDQTKRLHDIEEEVVARNKTIKELWKASGIQKKKFEEKLKIEKELEEGIKEQLLRIQDQEEKIATRNKKIGNQQKILSDQKQEIQKQKEILNEQLSEISTHKKINLYLIILMMLLLLAGVFVYRSYLTKKRLNKELKQKNIAINKQSLELASKNQELEQFAYIASHDLQEPLNTISSFIGLLAEDYKDTFDETGKESLGFIQDASIRMKNLIDALLQYSRLGRGKDIGLVDSNVILRDLKKDLKDVVEKSKASLVIANSLPILEGNEIELRLLFQNLISNGIKFRNKEVIPEIVISSIEITKEGKKYWKFSVEDNGIGIPEKHQERIFAIFQRLHSKDKYPGTGIGLAHCKKIVESHGGEIWLESSEGEGSTFFFTIPG